MNASRVRKLLRVFSDPVWRGAFLRHRVAASTEHAPVLRNLGALSSVVDIGGNRGQFALAVRGFVPECKIISFEPLPGPANCFRSLFASDKRVTLVEAAVGANAGQAEMYVSQRDDSSSLLPITDRQNALFPGTGAAGTVNIQVVKLKDVLPRQEIGSAALLKLDVQGFELEALIGCEELIEYFLWVYVECSFIELYEGQALAGDIVSWLRNRGFALCGVHNMTYDRQGTAVQADFLFRRSE